MPKPTLKTTDLSDPAPALRLADSGDLDALTTLEVAAFPADRISRRSFRYLLSRPTAETIVAEIGGKLAGYAMILFRAGTSLARLYSIAVDPALRQTGIGKLLLEAAEQSAFGHDRILLRLEVRADNERAIRFYQANGYHPIGRHEDYYSDHADALRFEKLLKIGTLASSRVPYYEQTEDFTCGPACLLMAFAAFIPGTVMNPVAEIRLWRQSTTIFMQSGPGGCEPYGLAVSAAKHGLAARIVTSHKGPLFLESVRSAEKRRVMRLAQEDLRQQAENHGIRTEIRDFSMAELRQEMADGGLAIVLVSGFRMFAKKVPHWVLVHGDDGHHVIIHDPWVEEDHNETATDAANLPIPYAVFERMARFGKSGLRAAVFLKASAL